MVQVVQLAVVVGAGGLAQVEVGATKELGLDLAGATASLLAIGLEDEIDIYRAISIQALLFNPT